MFYSSSNNLNFTVNAMFLVVNVDLNQANSTIWHRPCAVMEGIFFMTSQGLQELQTPQTVPSEQTMQHLLGNSTEDLKTLNK
jgi:hypothetical protein